MFKPDRGLQPKPSEAVTHEAFQHILIPACELGPERYREFRASRPDWRPKSYLQIFRDEGPSICNGCRECEVVCLNKDPNAKPRLKMESSGLSKGPKPISISVPKPNKHEKMPMTENIASFQAIHSPVVLKATQQYAHNVVALEERAILKPPLTIKPSGMEISSAEDRQRLMKSNVTDDGSEHTDSGRIKGANFILGQATASEHATSSEDVSENTMTAPQREVTRSSEHTVGASQGDKTVLGRIPTLAGSVIADESPLYVEDEDLFNYVLATRQIPYGHSFSNLGIAMQRRLHDYFKQSCPPCPHCNTTTYVKFRYFNNSGKSSLLQPRYSCRNPDTCLTIQEKTGKAGSRDFTLPKPKESDMNAPAVFASLEHANGQRGMPLKQPQMIQQIGSKRPAFLSIPLSEAAQRAVKLPNTNLSLQTLNEPGQVDSPNLQIVEASNRQSLQLVKPAEDSNSSSSIRTASDEKTAINVRCRAVETSQNGRLVVHPISVQQVGTTSSMTEAGSLDKPLKGGKVAELNICMYIDLSNAS